MKGTWAHGSCLKQEKKNQGHREQSQPQAAAACREPGGQSRRAVATGQSAPRVTARETAWTSTGRQTRAPKQKVLGGRRGPGPQHEEDGTRCRGSRGTATAAVQSGRNRGPRVASSTRTVSADPGPEAHRPARPSLHALLNSKSPCPPSGRGGRGGRGNGAVLQPLSPSGMRTLPEEAENRKPNLPPPQGQGQDSS